MTEDKKEPSELKPDVAPAPLAPTLPSPIESYAARHGPAPESQHERWMKYGSNVALTGIVVIVLAGLIIALAQAKHLHFRGKPISFRASVDVTSDASESLKPQTVSIINDLKTPIKLVSLYPRLKQDKAATEQDFYTPVVDLLDKYHKAGKNIDVEVIDPVNEPTKLDHWIGELKEKYGSNTKAYHDLLSTDLPKTLDELKKLTTAESDAMDKKLQEVQFKSEDQVVPFRAAYNTVAAFPPALESISKGTQEELEKQFPDYKAYTGTLKSLFGQLSRQSAKVRANMEKVKDDKDFPEPARQYAAGSLAHFDQMKKLADDLTDKINKLGELKLDEVRRVLFGNEGEALSAAIAVMGPTDIKLIQFNDVWKSGENIRMVGSNSSKPRLRFAGEQQTTSAIVALSDTKKVKVCFLRSGGDSLLSGGFMRNGGEMSDVGDRLKQYNFDVSEKDVTRDSSQPPPNQMMPQAPEPSFDDIKDAVWVVVSAASPGQFGPTPPSPILAEKLKEHLDQGGSAVCLVPFHGDALATALKDWGIEAKPEVLAVHDRVEASDAESGDFVETARRVPYVFVINEYGDSPVTTSLQTLDAALVPLCVVQTAKDRPADTTVNAILPVPMEPRSWGETDTTSLQNPDNTPKFNPATDIAPPIFGGATAEKKGKGRLVVIGCEEFVFNGLLRLPDPKLAKQKVDVARFPGNGELFTNSVFWCAHEDRMIALSPSALDTARIEPIRPGLLGLLRIGVPSILALLAAASGFLVFQSRRA